MVGMFHYKGAAMWLAMWLGGTGAWTLQSSGSLPSIQKRVIIDKHFFYLCVYSSACSEDPGLAVAMSFDHDRRVLIYPDYINSRRTQAEGRKVPVPKGWWSASDRACCPE